MILAILQARLSSTRMAGKVLSPLLGEPMILRQIERIRRSTLVGGLVVATSTEESDDPLARTLSDAGIDVRRGSLDDVLSRFQDVISDGEADHIVRLTGDNPLTDPGVIDTVLESHLASAADYTSNSLERTFPYGLDVEAIRVGAFTKLAAMELSAYDREHVTAGIYSRPGEFTIHPVRQSVDLSHLRWTVDYPEDFAFVSEVYARLYPVNPAFTMADVVALLDADKALMRLTSDVPS